MKRTLCAILGLQLLGAAAHAQLNYITNADTITITGCTLPASAVDIPATINGLPVTSIGTNAFYDDEITSVIIPNSVVSIESDAFAFNFLTSVTIPDSVTNIGEGAFDGCDLTNVAIGNGVIEIGDFAFDQCFDLPNVTIPSSVTSIGDYAFEFDGLTNVTIPGSVTNLGNFAFSGCIDLTGVTIPSNFTTVADGAFASCTRLTNVTIPSGVTNIEDEAFFQCSSLANMAIPGGVTSIGGDAFGYCGLTNITIPDSVTDIGEYAFTGCTNLTTVTIPGSINSIGSYLFSGCTSLTNLSIPGSVTSIGDGAFDGCADLTNLSIPDGVTNIGANAFASCSNLVNLTIPGGVNSIGNYFFFGCTSLTNVTIPGSATTIGEYAFSGCASLTTLAIPEGVTNIGDYAFSGCISLTSVTIPSSLSSIGALLFSGCASLTNVAIPSSVTTIEYGAFYDCSNLTGVFFQGNPPVIGSLLFEGDNSATLYYSPHTTGWSSPFADRPAVPWKTPPAIAITSPTSGSTYSISAGTISLAGTASDNMGVAYVTWSNRQTGGAGLANGSTLWTANNISLASGANVITITAYDAGGNHKAVALTVTSTTGSLQVIITPAAAVAAGAQWQLDVGPEQNSGVTVPDLSVGNHTISFFAATGWTPPAQQTVSIKVKSVARRKGSYTFTAHGIYNGLFMQSDVTEETAGMLSGLDITASGSYTGRLLIGGSTNTISGAFSTINGEFNTLVQASNYIPRTVKEGGALTLVMTPNWFFSPPAITGTVSGTNGGPWVANLTAELATNGSSSEEYTALLSPGVNPPGYGFLIITNHADAVAVSGTLADGTSFSQGVPSSSTGDLPVYGDLYHGTGLLLGWLNWANGSYAGNLTWIKEPSRFSLRYANGFTNLVVVQSSPWTNPLPHTAAIDLPFGQLDISGGSLLSPLSFNVAVSSGNTLVKLPGSPTNSLTGSISPKTGLLMITFGNGIGKETTAGSGVVLQNMTNAAGFFLGKTNAGSIFLEP